MNAVDRSLPRRNSSSLDPANLSNMAPPCDSAPIIGQFQILVVLYFCSSLIHSKSEDIQRAHRVASTCSQPANYLQPGTGTSCIRRQRLNSGASRKMHFDGIVSRIIPFDLASLARVGSRR
ncbi:hypothetical protein CaCOL14_003621 [Colletotrichum acutatum]